LCGCPLDPGHGELNIGTPVTFAMGNVPTNFGFVRFLAFRIGALRGLTHEKTDKQTDEWARHALQPIRKAVQ